MKTAVTGRARPPGGPERKPLGHIPPPWVKTGACYFVTICCEKRKANQLCHGEIAGELFAAATHYHETCKWHLRLMLLMPDHLHALLIPSPDESIGQLIGNWKRYITTKTRVNWQKYFFDHRLRNDDSWEEKAHYIQQNPVRDGLIRQGEIWPYQIQF